MSGQWELVTKSKKDKQNGAVRKLTKTEKKKFVENAPKVEDLLPLSQVKTLYSGFEQPSNETKPKPKDADLKKAQQKKAQQQQQQQLQQQQKGDKNNKPKESKPKTLDSAMNRISLDEFKSMVATEQMRFSDTPLVWLKAITAYLDIKLNVELFDPVFSNKSADYPLCLMPSGMRSHLKETLKSAGEANLQAFFEVLLTSLTHDMSKGGSAVGTKLMLQLLSQIHPKMALVAIPKCLSLQNSYQNRKPIWLSVLWAIGQAGFKDFAVGLKVWQDVMMPLMEMKNYAPFVVEYLSRLLRLHSDRPTLNVNQYLNALDAIYTPHSGVSNQLLDDLHSQGRKLRIIAVDNSFATLQSFFPPVMERLRSSASDAFKKELLELLWICLSKKPQCFESWRQLYPKSLPQSAALLRHIESCRKSGSNLPPKPLRSTLEFFIKTNSPLLNSKPKTDGLQDCQKMSEVLLNTMAVKKGSYWKLITFFLLCTIGAAVFYDVHLHGSFQKSSTGKVLKDTGALPYLELGLQQTKKYTREGLLWTQKNAPLYYASAVEYSKPYVELARDFGYLFYNAGTRAYESISVWVTKTSPVVETWLNEKAPGSVDKVKELSGAAWKGLNGFAMTAYESSKEATLLAVDWAKTNVLVGKLSPENLHKYTLEAVNATQTYASWTYKWVLEQVDVDNKAH